MTSLPVAASKIFTNLSALAVASSLPSGEKSRPKTVSLCEGVISRTSAPSAARQILTSPLREGTPPPVASHWPSGLKSSASTRLASGDFSSPVPMVRASVQFGPVRQTTAPFCAAPETSRPSGV